MSAEATITSRLPDGSVVTPASEGSDAEIVLDRPPFYTEAGGQIGVHSQLHRVLLTNLRAVGESDREGSH